MEEEEGGEEEEELHAAADGGGAEARANPEEEQTRLGRRALLRHVTVNSDTTDPIHPIQHQQEKKQQQDEKDGREGELKSQLAHDEHQQKRQWRDTVAGCVAGGGARLLTAPFDVVKIRYQVDHKGLYTSLAATFKSVYREEGIVSLWRGNNAAMVLWITYAGSQFGIYASLRPVLERWWLTAAGERPSGYLLHGVSGAVAGACATVLTYPLDITRTALAFQGMPKRYNSTWAFARSTYRHHGIKGFYKGLSPAVAQIFPQMGISFAVYQAVKDLDMWPSVAGFAAGTVSKLAVYPFDTVKKRVQTGGMLTRGPQYGGVVPAYKGPLSAALGIWRGEGTRALFRGTVPALLKSGLSSSITFALFEWARTAVDLVMDPLE